MGGLMTDCAVSEQPPSTSRKLSNVLPIDPTNYRKRLATRPGMGDILGGATLSNAASVRELMTSITKQKRTTFAELAQDAFTVEWDKTGAEAEFARGVKVDAEGNQYWLAANDQVVKRNADGKVLWTLPLPVSAPQQIVRAIDVSLDGLVFVGVSEGGDQEDALLWCFQPVRIGEAPEVLWEIKPGAFTADCKYKDGRLYTVQDSSDAHRSALIIYRNARTVGPTAEIINGQIPYPVSGIDVGPDGSAYIASPPNLRRGNDPRHPDLSPRRQDFVLSDLAQFEDRIWGHWRADEPQVGVTFEDGDEVRVWEDLSGNERHFRVVANKEAPLYSDKIVGEKPGIQFDPTIGSLGTGMITDTNANSNDPRNRERIRTMLPSYSGARFACFILLRVRDPNENDIGLVFQQGFNTNGSSATKLRANSDETAGTSQVAGAITWGVGGGNGTGNLTKDGVYSQTDGFALVTLVHNYDGASSIFRVNGTPYDQFNVGWDSEGTVTEQTELGDSVVGSGNGEGLHGDIIEILVLSDYVQDSDESTQLLTVPGYPNGAWSATSDTELERIEGKIMWEYGLQHLLDDGTVIADGTAGTRGDLSSNGNTGGFGTGTPYPHPFHLRKRFHFTGATWTEATNVLFKTGAFADFDLTLAVIQPATVVTDDIEITAGANVTPNTFQIDRTGVNNDDQVTLLGSPTGGTDETDLEGAFNGFLFANVLVNNGSPPNPDGRATSHLKDWYRRNLSFAGITEKWGPNGIDLNWNFTYAGASGQGVAVREITDDIINVWCIGPPYNSLYRFLAKIEDLGEDYDDIGANSWIFSGSAVALIAFDYDYLRIDVDKDGTVYFPFHDPDSSQAAAPNSLGLAKFDGTGLTYHELSASQQGFAVAHDPRIPDYDDDDVSRSEFLYVATRWEAANTETTQHKLRLVSRTLDAGATPREQVDFGVADGDIVKFETGAPVIPTGGTNALAVNSPWTHAIWFFGEVFFFDGSDTYKVYSRRTDTDTGAIKDQVTDWISTSAGSIPSGARLGMVYNGRMMLAGFEDNPSFYAMSAKDDARNWDMSPPIALSTQAITGPLAPAGLVPGTVTVLGEWTEDVGVIGSDHEIWLMRGDPMAGGRIDKVVPNMGMAFGRRNWALSTKNVGYFVNDDGQFCRWIAGQLPEPISEGRVDDSFRAINLSTYMPYLVYDRRQRGVWVFLVPYAATHAVTVEMYFFCEEVNGWALQHGPQGPQMVPAPGSFWPINFATAADQPVSSYWRDGDDPDDRQMLIGTSGGQVLEMSGSYDDDDGTDIDQQAVIGPLIGQQAPWFSDFTAYEVTLADELGGATLLVHSYDRPLEDLYEPQEQFDIQAGINDIIYEPVRGNLLYLELRSNERFAIEGSLACDIEPGGEIKRRVLQ